jgi:hypothetical protein
VPTRGVGVAVVGGSLAAGDGAGDEASAVDARGGGDAEIDVATGSAAGDGELLSILDERAKVVEVFGIGDGDNPAKLIEGDAANVFDVCIGTKVSITLNRDGISLLKCLLATLCH